ncbi:acetyltransferase [Aureimonas altamirensis]|uniref:Acetyltransferase n=2 Tax=Aureimonas altamirensis TaxID=370622 RepID=A0A0B1Q413_9HYPH|nr:acetyltransferase [Aureimonas altamirensis]
MPVPKQELNGLLVLGFGGHARSVADVALSMGIQELVFVDPQARSDETFAGHSVVVEAEDLPRDRFMAFPASGKGSLREVQMRDASLEIATLISPRASVGPEASISAGAFVGHGAHVGPQSAIGRGVILNTHCVVEHECVVGHFSHVSVNATMAGRSRLGSRSMLGAGAVIIDGVTVCDDVVIGAGAVVIEDISVPGTYVGVPARRIGGEDA